MVVKVGEVCPYCGEVKGFTPNYAKLRDSLFVRGVDCFRCGGRIDLAADDMVLVCDRDGEYLICGDCHGRKEVS
ncbi:MAG: hypothetical protein ACYSW3_29785 [Planctomycetota bacterium]|jgi:hypothetical protein